MKKNYMIISVTMVIILLFLAGCTMPMKTNNQISSAQSGIPDDTQIPVTNSPHQISDGIIKISNYEMKKSNQYELKSPKNSNTVFWVFNAAIANTTTAKLVRVDYPTDNSVSRLITQEGNTISVMDSNAYVVYLNPHDILSDYYITGIELVFEVPKTDSPKELSLVYSYQENEQSKSLKRGVFLIPF